MRASAMEVPPLEKGSTQQVQGLTHFFFSPFSYQVGFGRPLTGTQ